VSRHSLRALIAILLLSLWAAGCASPSRTRKPVTAAPAMDATKLSARAFDQLKAKTPIDEDRKPNAYIVCVAEALVRDVGGDWEVAIFRRDSPGAFVLPGGKIGVYSGILKLSRNQHQLAAVLAHGLAHVLLRHQSARLVDEMRQHPEQSLSSALEHPTSPEGQHVLALLGMESGSELPFDRKQESEANARGLDLMARAGFDPKESLTVWKAFERTPARAGSFPAIHPSYSSRSADLERQMPVAYPLREQALAAGKKPECDRLR
jgi:predicted Zn-dependent protease